MGNFLKGVQIYKSTSSAGLHLWDTSPSFYLFIIVFVLLWLCEQSSQCSKFRCSRCTTFGGDACIRGPEYVTTSFFALKALLLSSPLFLAILLLSSKGGKKPQIIQALRHL